MRTFFGLVGLGMFLGFGAIFVTSWQETRAFPDKPVKMTVHQAVLREEPGAGAWVELTDVRFPCDQPEQRPSSVAYRLGFGETTVLVRFLHLQQPVRLAFVPARPAFRWSAPTGRLNRSP